MKTLLEKVANGAPCLRSTKDDGGACALTSTPAAVAAAQDNRIPLAVEEEEEFPILALNKFGDGISVLEFKTSLPLELLLSLNPNAKMDCTRMSETKTPGSSPAVRVALVLPDGTNIKLA